MKCMIIRFFYRLLFFNFKRSFFLKHFYSNCLEKYDLGSAQEDQVKRLLKIEDAPVDNEIWRGVRKKILNKNESFKKIKRKRLKWMIPVTVSIIFVALVLFIKYSPKTKNQNIDLDLSTNSWKEKIEIKTLEIEGKKAKGYYFFSEDRKRLMVWVQKI